MNPGADAQSFPADRRFTTVIVSVLCVTVTADFLLWYQRPGLSLSFFIIVLAAAILSNRRSSQLRGCTFVALSLLLGAIIQSVIEISFSNILVLLILLAVLMGEAFFSDLPSLGARWSEALWSYLKLLGRWTWFFRALSQREKADAGFIALSVPATARLARIVLPVIFVTAIFITLLGNGNAIFGKVASDLVNHFIQWLARFDLSIGRVWFWFVCLFFALPFVQPGDLPHAPRFWTRTCPRLGFPRDERVAFWRSAALLGSLNALYFAVNTIDVIYLWANARLPAGVNYSAFVHQGVFNLTVAVLLAGAVLAALFQQSAMIAERRSLQWLALFWIGQNLLLVSGVMLRLRLYVEAYQLSELRVYVALFLLLVACGFVILAIHVHRQRSLNWLIFSNLLATFTLFYLVQFADVAGFVARSNVARWKNHHSILDVDYLARLGPSASPALLEAAQFDQTEGSAWHAQLAKTQSSEAQYLASLNWRSWQARHVYYARELLKRTAR
jgi:hypothetical protein